MSSCMGHGAMRDYLLFNLRVIIVSTMNQIISIFLVLLDNKNPTAGYGTVGFGFSPCYECNQAYRVSLDLYTTGQSKAYLVMSSRVNFQLVDGINFNYKLGPSEKAAKFLVQTIPEKKGKFRFKLQLVNPDCTKQDIFDYTTSGDGAPYGITYAVFGTEGSPNSAATYTFKDGKKNIITSKQINIIFC